jgi:hypothetical protein
MLHGGGPRQAGNKTSGRDGGAEGEESKFSFSKRSRENISIVAVHQLP